ncbi:MAG TPA: hypothetical protein VKR82_00165 [Candidatus Acidoferrales bacterium]|nr:hypothetical protein [Candidatus Acidoferrales bacterium]
MAENNPDRLESWKEIAEFINRDKRTAMRWVKELGMPVGRYPGGKKGRVYASRAAISVWKEALPNVEPLSGAKPSGVTPPGQEKPKGESETALPEKRFARKKWAWAGAAAILTALILGLVLVSSSRTLLRPKLPSQLKFTENGFDVFDEAGHELWSHSYSSRLDATIFSRSQPLKNLVRIEDFLGDGDREVLVVAPQRTGPNPSDLYKVSVDFFSSHGKLLWSYVPQEIFQFGDHTLSGPWSIFDLFVPDQSPQKTIWVVAVHSVWGNSFVVQLDPATGRETVRFVSTGVIYRVNELKTPRGNFLLAVGFNNEYNSGSLAIMDENKPFAASPQTTGTRHFCVSCQAGAPDYYFVFPGTEINRLEKEPEDSVRAVIVTEQGIEVFKDEREPIHGGGATIYSFRTQPSIEPVSLRYDTPYDMLHRELSAQGKLSHSLENCPERLHPKPVRMWTPVGGWTEIQLKPMKASD